MPRKKESGKVTVEFVSIDGTVRLTEVDYAKGMTLGDAVRAAGYDPARLDLSTTPVQQGAKVLARDAPSSFRPAAPGARSKPGGMVRASERPAGS